MEINNIDYTIGYNTATGKKISESRRREETPIIKWIRYILYKELEKMKHKFKIIITVDTTTGDISSRLEANRDCNIVGVEWR